MKYQLLKLKSGEELICSLETVSKTKYKLTNPYIFKHITMIDPISGLPCDVTVLKDWLNLTNTKTITIPTSHVVVSMTPSNNTKALYRHELKMFKEIKKEINPKDPVAAPELITPLLPKKPTNELTNINNIDENEIKDFLDRIFSGLSINPNAQDDSSPETPEDEYLAAQDFYNASFPPRKRKSNKNRPMIQMSMLFPPEVLIDLMESGLLNPNDIIKIAKEVKKKLKYTGDERHRADYGSKLSDWNPDPNSDDYK